MKLMLKKSISFLLALTMVITVPLIGGGGIKASAATFDEINNPAIFYQGKVSGPCNLAALTMLLRRVYIAQGKDWTTVTQSSVQASCCPAGKVGPYYSSNYNGISISHKSFSGGDAALKNLLENHLEGIVLYNGGTGGVYHGVLVTDYTDGVFYCADYNYGSPSGRIPLSSVYGKYVTTSNATEYWYVSSPSVSLEKNPSNIWVSLPNGADSYYKVNTPFDITFGADNATEYTLYIYNGDSFYWSRTYYSTTGSASGSVYFEKAGYYRCYVEAKNSSGIAANSSWIGWYVEDIPSNVWVSLPNGAESSYKVNETVKISFGADNACQYEVLMYKEQDFYWSKVFYSTTGTVAFDAWFYSTGHYSCYIKATNSLGEISVSQWIGWDIVDYPPTELSITVDKTNDFYTVDETITFNLYANTGYYKHIGIHKIDEGLYNESEVVGESYSINITEAGKYYADFDAFNACGTTRSEKVYFTVVDSVPDYSEITIVGGNKNCYSVGDTITFNLNTKNESSKYIGIHKEDKFYYGTYLSEYQYSYTFTESGSYHASFDALNPYGYTRSNDVSFVVYDRYMVKYESGTNEKLLSQNKIHNTDIYLNSTIPTRTGYIFKCWNTSADGSGISYNPGDTYTENADLTLYAIWERDTFSLKNSSLKVDTENGIVYGADLFGISQTDIESQFSNENMTVIMENDSRMATGTVLQLIDSDNIIYDTLTVVIFGDVNGDGWYDGEDAFMVNLIAQGLLDKTDVGAAVWAAADCNHDGLIDEVDVELLTNAGLLLNDVDQSASQAELVTNTAYIEYMGLIDQSFDINADNSANESENSDVADPAVGNDSERSETEGTDNEPVFDFEAIIAEVLAIIESVLSFVFSIIIK